MSTQTPPPPQDGPQPDQYGPHGPHGKNPAWQAAPTPPRRRNWFRRHKFLTALLAIVALVGLAQLGGGNDDAAPSASSSPTKEAAPAAETGQDAEPAGDGGDQEPAADEQAEKAPAPAQDDAPGVGDPVSAGDFEYTVTKVTPGVKQIGDSTFGQKPQGQFVLVKLSVTNTGSEAQMFNDSEHKLVDTEGREHSADGEAAIYVPGNDSFLEDVNPGNTLKGTIVFDVPADAKPQELKLMGPGFWDPAEVVVSVR